MFLSVFVCLLLFFNGWCLPCLLAYLLDSVNVFHVVYKTKVLQTGNFDSCSILINIAKGLMSSLICIYYHNLLKLLCKYFSTCPLQSLPQYYKHWVIISPQVNDIEVDHTLKKSDTIKTAKCGVYECWNAYCNALVNN